jgi:hypothetical protein
MSMNMGFLRVRTFEKKNMAIRKGTSEDAKESCVMIPPTETHQRTDRHTPLVRKQSQVGDNCDTNPSMISCAAEGTS